MRFIRSILQRFPWRLFSTGLSLAVGILVPSIFELGARPAARSRHYSMEHAAIAVIVVTVIGCALRMWFDRSTTIQTTDANTPSAKPAAARKVQFKLWQVFIGITVIAVGLGLIRFLETTWLNGLIVVIAFAILGWGSVQGWHVFARLVTLNASMFLPCVWMIVYNKPFGRTSGLVEFIPTCPGILHAGLLSALFGMNLHEGAKIAPVVVILQLLLGAWLAKRGGTISAVYTCLVFLASSLSSLAMHGMYRA
jgi:hypothetical protein